MSEVKRSGGVKLEALAAARLHRRRVSRWLKVECTSEGANGQGSYSLDDAIADLCGVMVENGWNPDNSSHVRRALRALRSRPYGYCKPEPIEGSLDAEFVELATLLIESTRDAEIDALGSSKDDRKRKAELHSMAAFVRAVVVDHGRKLVGAGVLVDHCGIREWSARQFLESLRTNCRRVVSELTRRQRLQALLAKYAD